MKQSITGYKSNSKDRFEPMLEIPSNNITMQGVNHPVIGIDDLGNIKVMKPKKNYVFPGSNVTEIPIKQKGGTIMKKKFNPKEFESYLSELNEDQQDQLIDYMEGLEDVERDKFMCGGKASWKKYQQGGTTNLVPVEVEDQETVQKPNGELHKFNGNTHAEGGIDAYLEPGSRIYSDHLKVPKEVASTILGTKVTKKLSYADLSKKFDTTKWSKILDNPDSDKYAKETAKLKLSNNNSMLDIIFQAQELSKGKGLQGKFQDKQYAQMGLTVGDDPIMRLKKTYPERSDTLPEILITGKRTVKDYELLDRWFDQNSNKRNTTQTVNKPNPSNIDYTAFDQAFNRGSNDVVSPQTESVNEKVEQKDWNVLMSGVPGEFIIPPGFPPNLNPNAGKTVLPLVEPDRSKPQVAPVQPIPTRSGGKSSSKKSTAPLPVSTPDGSGDIDMRSWKPLDLLGTPLPSSVTSERSGVPDISNYEVDIPGSTTSDKKKSAFGIGSKLAGTILDIGLAASDKLRVVNPQYRDLRKQPLFSRFVDFDDKEAGRNMSLNIQQIQNSNMPEEVKQSRIADLNAQYKDYTAKIDFANAQRYEQKIGQDTEKLQNYINANIDQHYQDIEVYNQKKARVDELVDAFKAQKRSRIVNSIKQYAEYSDKINYYNQIYAENYKINPISGRVEFTKNTPDPLKKQEQLVSQYSQNQKNQVSLPNGAMLTMLNESTGIVTDANGKTEIVKLK